MLTLATLLLWLDRQPRKRSGSVRQKGAHLALDPLRMGEEYVVTGARQLDDGAVCELGAKLVASGPHPRVDGREETIRLRARGAVEPCVVQHPEALRRAA